MYLRSAPTSRSSGCRHDAMVSLAGKAVQGGRGDRENAELAETPNDTPAELFESITIA